MLRYINNVFKSEQFHKKCEIVYVVCINIRSKLKRFEKLNLQKFSTAMLNAYIMSIFEKKVGANTPTPWFRRLSHVYIHVFYMTFIFCENLKFVKSYGEC